MSGENDRFEEAKRNGEAERIKEKQGSRNAQTIETVKVLLEDETLFQTFLTKVEENTQLEAPRDMKERILNRANGIKTGKNRRKPGQKKQLLWYGIKVGMGVAAAIVFTFSVNFTAIGGADYRYEGTAEQTAADAGGRQDGLFGIFMEKGKQAGSRLLDGLEQSVKNIKDSLEELAGVQDPWENPWE